MKKTLLSVLAGLTVIGAATALPTPDDRRAQCEKNKDTMVWVQRYETCVPINPCTSVSESIRDNYCSSKFRDIKVRDVEAAERLVDRESGVLWAPNRIVWNRMVGKGLDAHKYIVATDTEHTNGIGSFYYYQVYEFDEIGDHSAQLGHDAFKGACRAYHGIVSSRHDYSCVDYDDNGGDGCQNIKDLAELVYGDVLNIVQESTVIGEEYTGDYFPETKYEKTCKYEKM